MTNWDLSQECKVVSTYEINVIYYIRRIKYKKIHNHLNTENASDKISQSDKDSIKTPQLMFHFIMKD